MSAGATVYSGSVSIMDYEGNVVFEQELSTNEIIERLLASIPSEQSEESEEETPDAESPPEPGPKREKTHLSHASTTGCDECGSLGRRHKNGCARAGKSASIAEVTAVSPALNTDVRPAEMLTEDQYELVVDAKENDFRFSPSQCAEELEVDVREVNRAVLMGSWSKYQESYERSV